MKDLKSKEITGELHDEDINEIVEETLEETSEPKGNGVALVKAPSEEESIASVDKAAKATTKTSLPKTKAGMISAMYQGMSKMGKSDLTAAYSKMMGESVDDSVVEAIDTGSELDALVESEATLSEEFKQKTAIIFDAAVKSKLSEEVTRLEESYKEELSEEVATIKEDLVSSVDSYLNYVVESWMEDNKLAIQNGLRTEIAENFMTKMRDVFVESYVQVPEAKVDLVDELAEQVTELEEKLNSTTGDAIALAEELETYKRESLITEACRDLADTQTEKLKGLVENITFADEADFSSRINTIKESYFSKEIVEQTEVATLVEDTEQDVEVSSTMDQYLTAIRKTTKQS
tara:strand:- start:1159 stop:2202 length:1044 start_codon:yes stop_codon:yes gene_type:complete